ncbi:hypothetical protein L207DRAFT_577554 [Hyaloscypha variabilis F]|uniref:MYND-type domain-containing protein n=1 Tax=Hyaloscypha variabilis (strain UAMH 11265 / GT02V1 / F) TaxID=1149755 RepID=A0A2J6S7G3_HYAVF|nr:hypothetical protein L207DRAFT_577554 [Hyaloscypha variabilis F]
MANHRCCVCNAPRAIACSSCKSAYYCGSNCQKNDWRTHKLLCRAFATFDKEKRPIQEAVLALYFPILKMGEKGLSAPQMIWINPEHESGEMHIVELNPDGTFKHTDPLKHDEFEARNTQARNMSTPVHARDLEIQSNYKRKFQIDHMVVLHMRCAFNFDGSRVNITLVEVMREQLRMRWKGPLVFYAKSAGHNSLCRDVTLSDFRTLLDFFKKYQSSAGGLTDALRTNNYLELEVTNQDLFKVLLLHNSNNWTFRGVEIPCEADKRYLAVEQYIAVDVPVVHPIFDDVNQDNSMLVECGVLELSKKINLPLLLRRIFPDKRWVRRPELTGESYRNSVAEYLNLNTDISSPKWGSRNLCFSGRHPYGRLLVVREDKTGITAHQVEAVAAYFKHVFEILDREKSARLGGFIGVRLCEMREELMNEHVSRVKFARFFGDFKNQKIASGDASWANEVLP